MKYAVLPPCNRNLGCAPSPLWDATFAAFPPLPRLCPPPSPCRRNLSCPLFEQERLRYYRSNYEPRPASPPVGVPPLATTSTLSPTRHRSSHPVIGNIMVDRSGPGGDPSSPRQLGNQEEESTGPGEGRLMGSREAGPGGNNGSPAMTGEEAGLAAAGHDGIDGGSLRSRSDGSGSGSGESVVMEARRRWLLGCAGDADDEEEEEGEEEGGDGVCGDEEAERSGEGARATPLFERLPLGMPCKHGSDSQALWLACNDDVLLGRADNGERVGAGGCTGR